MTATLPGLWPRTAELLEITSYDPAASAEVTDYLATADLQFVDDPDAPAVEYLGLIRTGLTYAWRLFDDAGLGGPSLPAAGEIEIVIDDQVVADGTLARWLRSAFDGRRVRWLRGAPGAAYADYQVILAGSLSGQRTIARTGMRLGVRDLGARIQQPLAGPTYAGTGGVEGGEDLAGRRRPELFGLCRAVSPILVDAATQLHDVSWSGLAEVLVVADGAAPLTLIYIGDPAPGEALVDLASGRVRLGADPTFGVTVNARGAAAGGATDPAAVAAWVLANRLGFAAGEIDSAAFAALSLAWPHATGFYTGGEDTDGQALLDLLLPASAGAWYSSDPAGRVTCGLWRPTDAATEDDCTLYIDEDDIVAGGVTLTPVATAPSRVEIGHARCWSVVSDPTRLAAAAPAGDVAFVGQEYRLATTALTHGHLLAAPLRIDTALDGSAAAAALAATAATAEAGWLDISLQIAGAHPALQPAAQIWIKHADFGLDLPARLLGLRVQGDGATLELRAWP
jgi:hypothetical protein